MMSRPFFTFLRTRSLKMKMQVSLFAISTATTSAKMSRAINGSSLMFAMNRKSVTTKYKLFFGKVPFHCKITVD